MNSRQLRRLSAVSVLICCSSIMSGCMTHTVAFPRESFWYDAPGETCDARIVAVIDRETLDQRYSFRAYQGSPFLGLFNQWEVRPGVMLNQVASVELPQMARNVEIVTALGDAMQEKGRLVLLLNLEKYTYDGSQVQAIVKGVAQTDSGRILFDKRFLGSGASSVGVMTMTAPDPTIGVREASLRAYKTIFSDLRAEIIATLRP